MAARSRGPRLSREGVPYDEYRWGDVLVATPFAFGLTAALKALSLTTTEVPADGASRVPANAILYLFHRESLLVALTPRVWSSLAAEDFAYLSYHGALSYIGGLWPYVRGYRCFRYTRGGADSPLAQVIVFLKGQRCGRFMVRTDSGGPYGKVRASLVDIAVQTGRPLVAMRQFASAATSFAEHVVPRPGAQIVTCLSPVIAAEILAQMRRDDARCLVQEAIDRLAPRGVPGWPDAEIGPRQRVPGSR